MMKTCWGVSVICLLFAAGLGAQHAGHDHGQQALLRPAAAQYAIRARVHPEQGLVQTWMDLSYTNAAQDVMPSLIFGVPEGDALVIDSILWMGTPLDSSRIKRDDKFLTLRIPLNPGENAPLILAFSTRIDGLSGLRRNNAGAVYANDWYPAILGYFPGSWAIGSKTIPPTPEIGDYRVELVIDTPYHLAASGTFANEVDLIGLVPDRTDSIIYDLFNRPNETAGAGRRTYFFASTGTERFNFVALRDPHALRIVRERQKVDLYSFGKGTGVDNQSFVREAARISEAVIDWLGPIPDGRFTAVMDRRQFDQVEDYGLAHISSTSRDPDIVLVEFASALVGQYFTSTLPDTVGLSWSEGAVIYVTASVLHGLYGDKGYGMLAEWLDWTLPPRDVSRFLAGRSPFAWMENVRKPNRPWTPADSLKFEALFVTSSALSVVGSYADADSADALLLTYSLATRHRHPAANELVDLIAAEIDPAWRNRLAEWQNDHREFDWSIAKPRLESQGGVYRLSVQVESSALPSMPVEIAIIGQADTLYRVLSPQAGSNSTVFTEDMPSRPQAVLIDPHRLLPDRNRQNNFHSFVSTSTRYKSRQSEYPTFRRLTRGD